MKIKTTPILVALTFLLTACGSGDGTPTSDNATPDNNSSNTSNGETTNGETTNGDDSNSGSGDNNNGNSITSENTVTGDPDPVTNDGNTIRLGQLVAGEAQTIINNATANRTLNIGATFYEYQSTATQTDLVQLLTGPNEESCTVITATNPQPIFPELPTAVSSTVSAGETITITSGVGTYSTLMRNIDGDRIDYGEQAELNGSFPQGLVASIPGDVFPAYSNVAIPHVPALRVTSPTADQIFAPSTPITWDVNDNSDTIILIQFLYVDTTNFDQRLGFCTVIDDGSFALPASAITELALDDNYSISLFGVTRIAGRLEINGTSALQVSNSYGNLWLYTPLSNP